ncbi:hypothetical protein D3C72_650160 [compost metagenome]
MYSLRLSRNKEPSTKSFIEFNSTGDISKSIATYGVFNKNLSKARFTPRVS